MSASSVSLLQRVAKRRLVRRKQERKWPTEYVNSKTGETYKPHNESEHQFVYSDTPRYMLLRGGEGAGKSVAGIIKDLERLRRGMSGIMVSPDLEHFKKSLWPEFKRWIPWPQVIDKQQYRQELGWEPTHSFTLVFKNGSILICGGAKEDQIGGWEGPNVNFVHCDEIRRHKTAIALKTFDGRIRIPGPLGESPGMWFTTTPRKHWLFEYFAGAKGDEQSLDIVSAKILEQHTDFRANAFVATVLTKENEDAGNLEPGFTKARAQTLDQAEVSELLEAGWEDVSDTEKFVNIIWWDNCHEQLTDDYSREPMVIALDAAEGSENPGYIADCFAMIAVTRHPVRPEDIAIRYQGIWQPAKGQLLDYEPIETELRKLCEQFSVIEIAYDPTQLHYLCSQLAKKGIGNFQRFKQGEPRKVADKGLQTLIASRKIVHDGNPLMRQHIDNSYVKKYIDGSVRIVKRSTSMKIDAAVALSMASNRILYYNL